MKRINGKDMDGTCDQERGKDMGFFTVAENFRPSHLF
jgi:hypothetical protein